MYSDTIGDFLTRIRNAVKANHKIVEIPASNLKVEMTRILMEQGYILNYKKMDDSAQGTIKIALKYDRSTKQSAIRDLQRISKPGLRKYSASSDVPRIKNGLGIAIVSTNRGVMTDKEARKQNVGGEVLCYVY